jgi:hypothetical protein
MSLSYSEDFPPLEELVLNTIEFDNNISFKIHHNLGEQLDAAIMNWSARTTELTAESLATYIKSKRDKGYTEHWVLTEDQYKQALLDNKTKQQ